MGRKGLRMKRLAICLSGLMTALCVCAACAATALASAEFEKVNNQVKTSAEGAFFQVPNALVGCVGTGQGKVNKTTTMKLEVKYSQCKAAIGEKEAKDVSATVSSCVFVLGVGGELTLSSGCKIEAGGCTLEPAAGAKQAKGVGYSDVKTEEKGGSLLETNIGIEASEMEYKANSECEKLGVKGGKELTIDEYSTAQGVVAVPNAPKFWVEEGNFGKKLQFVSTKAYELIIPTNVKTITCSSMSSEGANVNSLEFTVFLAGSMSFFKCKTNIIAEPNKITLTTISPACSTALGLTENDMAGSILGYTRWLNQNWPCEYEARISLCVMKYRFRGAIGGNTYTNTPASNPKTVTLKQSGGGGPNTMFEYEASSACPAEVRRRGDDGILRGEGEITAKDLLEARQVSVEVKST